MKGVEISFKSHPSSYNKTHKIQYMDLKKESNQASTVSIMVPNLNFEQITYYQPEIINDDPTMEKEIFKIEKFNTKSSGPMELRRISDIEVKSYKPLKKMKFRRKKKYSSIVSKVEAILNRGKRSLSSRDPSEESVVVEYDKPTETIIGINDLPESILQKIFFWLTFKEQITLLPRVCK